MSDVLHHLRLAVRGLLRAPGFALAAIVTLAVGIGASAAVFAVLHSVVLAPLPYAESEELVWVDSPVPGVGADAAWGLSEAGFHHFRANTATFAELGVFATGRTNLTGDGEARRITAAFVSGGLVDVLRARPVVGRLIRAEDNTPGAPPIAVLSHAFWQREFGGDPNVVGRTLTLDAQSVEVVGVMAAGLELPDQPVDLWLALGLDPSRPAVNAHWLQAVGRLRPGIEVAAAQQDVARLTSLFPETFPNAYSPAFMRESGFRTRVTPLRAQVIGGVGEVLWVLYAGVGLVLLIALANVANLLVVRTESRQRELAIRTALGASRGQLMRHWLAEGLVLAAAAGVVGLMLAGMAVDFLLALSPAGIPRLREVSLTGFTFTYVAGVAAAVGVALGLWPMLHAALDLGGTREAAQAALRSRAERTVRPMLVAGQIAIALVLLAAAGLMFRSVARLRAVPAGLEPAGVLAVDLSLPFGSYGSYAVVAQFYRRLLERVEAVPGVQVAGAGQGLPLRDFGGCSVVFVETRPLGPDEQPPCVSTPLVSPGYFAALGIPLRGAQPGWLDVEGAAGGVVVTPALARRLWPGEDPMGKGIRPNGWAPPFYRVVGVTGELRAEGLDRAPTEAVFFPIVPMEGAPLWAPPRAMTLAVRARTDDPAALGSAVRRAVAELDAGVALGSVETMERIVARSVARRSFVMLLLGIAAVTALVLSVVGVYGVVAYAVERRRGEMSLRMALGARAEQVSALMVRGALRMAVSGALVGLVVAVGVTRALAGLLFEVSPVDPVSLGGAALLLTGVAAAAGYLPARHAARVHPMEALRHE